MRARFVHYQHQLWTTFMLTITSAEPRENVETCTAVWEAVDGYVISRDHPGRAAVPLRQRLAARTSRTARSGAATVQPRPSARMRPTPRGKANPTVPARRLFAMCRARTRPSPRAPPGGTRGKQTRPPAWLLRPLLP